MNERIHAPHVGAPDPELSNSPIIEETDDDFEVLGMEVDERPTCLFNGHAYPSGQWVCSGDELLRCERGAWVREGSCDPDHAP
jgi:hypothetical protein